MHLPAVLLTGNEPQGGRTTSECHLSLLSLPTGGTDIISCFMGQNVSIPVYKGEIQARNLAMAVEAWDEEGDFLGGG